MMWLRAIVISVLMLGASALFAHMMFNLVRFLRMGQPSRVPLALGRRASSFMVNYFGQGRVIREPAGIAHFFFFWGFWVVQLETLEYIVRAFYWKFHWTWFDFIEPSVYNAVLGAQDIIGFALIAAVTFAIVRRFVFKPQHATITLDAAIILGLEVSLIVTKYIANGAEIAMKAPEALGHNPTWTPLAFAFSQLLGGPGGALEPDSTLGVQGAWILHNVGFWCHLGTVFFFLGYIPFGKHLHIFGAGFNVLLRKVEPKGALYPLSFDNEDAEKFGANQLEDLTWKQLLDAYACTECGRCQHYCPAYNTGKALNPMMIVRNLKSHIKEKGQWLIDHKGELAPAARDQDYHTYAFAAEIEQDELPFPSLLGNVITREELWACTTCGACVGNCPVFIEHVDTILDMRRYLTLTEGSASPELTRTFKNIEASSNPWGISASYRGDWAQDLDIPLLKDMDEAPDYLFFVGCAGSFDDRQKKVTRAFAKILKEAGVSFGILGKEEKCTGDPARRGGNEYLYQETARQNVETFSKYKVTRIITTCPHCFHTIGKEYPQLGGHYEVLHHTELLAELLRTGRVKLKPGAATSVTYHDSCYIGRWAGILDAPREILEAVPNFQPREMDLNRNQSFCCGAGGAQMWMEEHHGQRINVARADQALATEAEMVAVACPFCMTMFDGGLKQRGADHVRLVDLAEIVADHLIPAPAPAPLEEAPTAP